MAMTMSQRRKAFSIFRYFVLTIWLLIAAFPIFWMVSTSFKPERDWIAWPPVYISENPTVRNYLVVWTDFTGYEAELDDITGDLVQPNRSLARLAWRNAPVASPAATATMPSVSAR